MQNKILFFLLFLAYGVNAQNRYISTEKFSIEGRVKKALTYSIADLDTFKIKLLPDIVITNHLGEKKNQLTNLKGILLKDVLLKAELDAESPKVLSEYYFVFVASDNYKIVFSWNELFNTETGNNVYIIMEEGGKKIRDLEGRISIVCLTDFKTGRRHLSNLDRILVQRAN